MRAPIALFVVSIIGGIVLGVFVLLGAEPNNDFWLLVVGFGVANGLPMAAFATTLPSGSGRKLVAAIGLLITFITGAFVAGASMRHYVFEAWQWELGSLAVVNALIVSLFAVTCASGGTLARRLAMATSATIFAAGLISAGFWIGVKVAGPERYCDGDGVCIDTLGFGSLWAWTAAGLAIIGLPSWGLARIIVRVMAR